MHASLKIMGATTCSTESSRSRVYSLRDDGIVLSGDNYLQGLGLMQLQVRFIRSEWTIHSLAMTLSQSRLENLTPIVIVENISRPRLRCFDKDLPIRYCRSTHTWRLHCSPGAQDVPTVGHRPGGLKLRPREIMGTWPGFDTLWRRPDFVLLLVPTRTHVSCPLNHGSYNWLLRRLPAWHHGKAIHMRVIRSCGTRYLKRVHGYIGSPWLISTQT